MNAVNQNWFSNNTTNFDESDSSLEQWGNSFDTLYNDHAQKIYRLGWAMLQNSQAAEDVVQETFLRAYKARKRFNPNKASVGTWLYQIALNYPPPQGTIAFSFFNPASERYAYEIQLISLSQEGNIRRVFSHSGVSEPALRWGSDGIELAYRAWGTNTAARSLVSSILDNNLNTITINEVGGFWEDAHPDWSPIAPDWSPNSEEIAYTTHDNDNNWDLYLLNSDGSHLRRLTTHSAIDGLPTWSPDGKWLAFISNRDGNWGIWLLHINSGTLQLLFSFDGGTFTPPIKALMVNETGGMNS